jgi:mannose-6-phosphate isomerase
MQLPKEAFGEDGYVPEIIPRLSKQYNKTDPGIVVALITMNYLRLRPRQSIYIPTDSFHASGDIIECMARSNNVLDTRFCPSADRNLVDMLYSVLTSTPHNAEEAILPSGKFLRSKNGKTNLYALPTSEFNILATETGDGETESRDALGGPSIVIMTKGRDKMKVGRKEHGLDEGYVFFIGMGEEITFEACRRL